MNQYMRGILGIILIAIPIMISSFGVMSYYQESSIIQGYVYDYDTSIPSEGAFVYIMGGVQDYTDSNGYYSLNLPMWLTPEAEDNSVIVKVSKDNYITQSNIVLIDAGETLRRDWYISQTTTPQIGWVEGVVCQSIGGKIEGATVNTNGISTTSNADGGYGLILDAPDTYTIVASKSGYDSQTHTVELSVGETIKLNFYLVEDVRGSVSGHVYVGDTTTVISHAYIQSGGLMVVTNDDGYYTWKLEARSYDLTACKDGYISQSKTIVITTNENKILNFHLTHIGTADNPDDDNPVGGIRGYVIGSTRDAIYNARIELKSSSNSLIIISEGNGYYEALGVLAGTYTVSITANGYEDLSDSVTIVDTIIKEKDFTMSRITSGDDPSENDTPDEEKDSSLNSGMLIITALMIGIGVALLLSLMTMNIIILSIGFIGSAGMWVLYNWQYLGGLLG